MTYVVSDIHGEFKLFKKLLEKIQFTDKDTLYILGDVVDRGPEPVRLLQYILSKKNIILLRGNHEQMLLDYFEDDRSVNNWLEVGGRITLNQLQELKVQDLNEILNYLVATPFTKCLNVDGIVIRLVHAGLEYENGKILEYQNAEFLLWAREKFIEDTVIEDDIVIFGHTPTFFINTNGTSNIHLGCNKIAIDCGATFYNGKLACLRLEDFEQFDVRNEPKKPYSPTYYDDFDFKY